MGKQYKSLKDSDKEFISKQKLFYIASSSGKEVNLSPKGYETLKVLDDKSVVFLDYPGSGNRTYSDTMGDGEFTILFNAFEGKAMILRLFCKSKVVARGSSEFTKYRDMFDEKESIIRNFFLFSIYAVESSCGDSVPYMEYKSSRDSLKEWAVKMDSNGKLEKYIDDHTIPPNLQDI
ncbi:MAG: pyridoxamine 5'-phosphate oxidase family protein [Campylobacterota bacterium]|nr:pyridoxamine 5'-phosphate oxidase family protein [Campylobacterota bacterium]